MKNMRVMATVLSIMLVSACCVSCGFRSEDATAWVQTVFDETLQKLENEAVQYVTELLGG